MTTSYADSRQGAMHWRLAQVLGDMIEQMPKNVKQVDLWRPMVVDHNGFADDLSEVWVRLAEDVYSFKMEREEHWILTTVGKVMKPKGTYLLLADDYEIKPDDHVIMDGQAYIVDQIETNGGLQKLTLDKQGSRYTPLARSEGLGGLPATQTYRVLGMKARIT